MKEAWNKGQGFKDKIDYMATALSNLNKNSFGNVHKRKEDWKPGCWSRFGKTKLRGGGGE